jgi:hypothetical protein
MKSCALIITYVRTHRGKELVVSAMSADILSPADLKDNLNGVVTISSPTKADLTKIMSEICRRYHDKLLACENCPVNEALETLNIAMDTFSAFYAPFFPVTCRCHKKR